jgi:16S rRNA processing protein RimM
VDELIVIGTVRTAWGVKGWVKLMSFSGEWDHFADLQTVVLRPKSGRSTREYRVEDFRMHNGGGMMKLAGVDSPEVGKSLAGSEILVTQDHAAPLREGEWYLKDLIGLSLVGPDGKSFGQIVGVIEAADDLLEIERPDHRRFMVPFRTEFVGEPNLQDGVLVLNASWLADEL